MTRKNDLYCPQNYLKNQKKYGELPVLRNYVRKIVWELFVI